jgi:hypothetical protein
MPTLALLFTRWCLLESCILKNFIGTSITEENNKKKKNDTHQFFIQATTIFRAGAACRLAAVPFHSCSQQLEESRE